MPLFDDTSFDDFFDYSGLDSLDRQAFNFDIDPSSLGGIFDTDINRAAMSFDINPSLLGGSISNLFDFGRGQGPVDISDILSGLSGGSPASLDQLGNLVFDTGEGNRVIYTPEGVVQTERGDGSTQFYTTNEGRDYFIDYSDPSVLGALTEIYGRDIGGEGPTRYTAYHTTDGRDYSVDYSNVFTPGELVEIFSQATGDVGPTRYTAYSGTGPDAKVVDYSDVFGPGGGRVTTTGDGGRQTVYEDGKVSTRDVGSTKTIQDIINRFTGGKDNTGLLAALLGGILGLLGKTNKPRDVGYQGGIPKYTAKRVPGRGVEYTRAAKGGLMSLAEGGPAEIPTANAAPAISNEQIANFVSGVQARGGNNAEIAAAMDQYGVTPAQMAGALGVGTDVIQNRYNVATPTGKYSTAPNLGGVVLAGDSWLSDPDHSSRISQQLGGANVVNTAIGGSTTGDILNRLNTYLDQGGRFDPGTTVMMNIGGNDLLRGLEADQISQNINQIASLLGERGANLILSGAPQIGSVEDITSSTSLGLNPIYQEIADANRNVTLVDSMADLLNQKNLVDESGFHLNEIGKNAFDASLAQAYRRSQGMGEFALPDEVVRQYIEENRLTPSQARGIARYFDLTDADIDRILGTARAAGGGLMGLAGGGRPARYLRGGTDGMADKIETSIDGKQPARLSHGEFVVPADVVSHLGNGNSDAGADVLYDMMAKVRKARTGTTKQGKQINPRKMIPA